MSMIFSNVGGDLKNYRLQVIDSWVDGESPELLDNPKDGDMISFRSMVDGVPTVTATKVYSDGEWVDAGGGGGGGGGILWYIPKQEVTSNASGIAAFTNATSEGMTNGDKVGVYFEEEGTVAYLSGTVSSIMDSKIVPATFNGVSMMFDFGSNEVEFSESGEPYETTATVGVYSLEE